MSFTLVTTDLIISELEIPNSEYLMELDGTFLMLLANPDSHFSLQKPINIMEGFLLWSRRLLP
jgi:hypothetical protein